jgi:hypothetical protein
MWSSGAVVTGIASIVSLLFWAIARYTSPN